MRDEGRILGGDELSSAPDLFIGAVANPFADPFSYRVLRLGKKVNAGAEFIQTQCIYNLPKFKEWMGQVRDRGIDKKVFILGGVTPLKSARMAEYMGKNVAGMDIPEEIIARMKSVAPKEQRAEGLKVCVETIKALREIPGIRGVHIMAIEWEEAVRQLVEEAGLFPRPEV
jgi:methylenetetrahydrofolate reductase (NADPH)